ncbi:MAG: sigma-70 family RNA polymerase sigma factor [Clostridia bacterium]|nr:sigma-70 family RNA polymerase sigma factor [Clostridia bacterium]
MLSLCLSVLDTQDETLFLEIYLTYRDPMFRSAYDVLHNFHDAEDALQETFLALAKNFSPIRRLDPSKYFSYLCRAARNHALNHCVKQNAMRKREILYSLPEVTDKMLSRLDATLNEICRKNDLETVRRCVQELPMTYRDILYLSIVDNLKAPKIAAMLGMSHAAVRQQLHRGKEMLLESLKKEGIVPNEKTK